MWNVKSISTVLPDKVYSWQAYSIETGLRDSALDFGVAATVVSEGRGGGVAIRFQYSDVNLSPPSRGGRCWSSIRITPWNDYRYEDGGGRVRIVALPSFGSAEANKDAHISTTITQDELNNALYGIEVERRRAGSEDWGAVSDIRSRSYDATTRKLTITTDADQRDDEDVIQPQLWQFRFRLKGFVHTPEVGPDYPVSDSNQLTAFAPVHLPPIEHVPDD